MQPVASQYRRMAARTDFMHEMKDEDDKVKTMPNPIQEGRVGFVGVGFGSGYDVGHRLDLI